MNEAVALKAWAVNDYHWDRGVVVFASTRGAAQYQGAREIDREFLDVECVRAPSFDALAPGPLTPKQYVARGWKRRCGREGCRTEWVTEEIAVYAGEEAYCSAACRDAKAEGTP